MRGGENMNSKNEQGNTAIEIAICVVIIFILVSLISTLIYNFNSSAKEIELQSQATNLAINEIENMKNKSFEEIKQKIQKNKWKRLTVMKDFSEKL